MKKKKIYIGVLGSSGKMGQALRSLLKNNKELISFVEVTRTATQDFENSFTDLNLVSPLILAQVDVWIDFSRPEVLKKLIKVTKNFKTCIVSGTTGLTTADFKLLKTESRTRALFWASNMSQVIWFLRQAIQQLGVIAHFDFGMEEIHHTQKVDNPSGTALTLHQDLEKAVHKKIKKPEGHRLGGVYGYHSIIGASQSEIIKIEHQALNRTVFAEGALKAAVWVVKQPPGFYSMEHLFKKTETKI